MTDAERAAHQAQIQAITEAWLNERTRWLEMIGKLLAERQTGGPR